MTNRLESFATHALRSAAVFSVLGVSAAGLTCERGSNADSLGWTVVDSAGVVIVMNDEPAWPKGNAWQVLAEPEVSIGAFGGDSDYELYQVGSATRFADGMIAVLNAGTHEVRFYDADGRYLRSIGRDGEGPGEFRRPSALFRLGSDSLVVWDSQLRRVSVFLRHGVFARSFTIAGTAPYSVTNLLANRTLLAATGNVYRAGASEGGVHRDTSRYVILSLKGDSVGSVGSFPSAERFVRLAGGGMSVTTMLFSRTTRRAVYDNLVFVGTNDEYAIDVYDDAGNLVRSIRREVTPTVVTAELFSAEVEHRISEIEERFREIMAPLYEDMPRSEVQPFYSGLLTDPDGHLWVRRYTPESDPEWEWSVFDSSGRWLGDVVSPTGLEIYEVGRDYVLGLWRDETDIEFVHLHDLIRR